MLVPQTMDLRHARPAELPDRIELETVPFVQQDDFLCGPSALAMSIGTIKPDVSLDQLIGQVYLPGRQGSLQIEMLAAPRRHGLLSYQLAPRMEDALREVAAGTPVIVLQDFGVWPISLWHYAVIVGYDLGRGHVILRSGRKRRSTMPFAVLEYLWRDGEYWSMVVMPPHRSPATATEDPYLKAIAALERAGQTLPAKSAYATFLQRWPRNTGALLALANTQHASGEIEQASATLRRALDTDPTSVPVLNNLAQTLSDLGYQRDAMTLAERAVELGGPHAAEVGKTREGIVNRLQGPMRPGACPRQ